MLLTEQEARDQICPLMRRIVNEADVLQRQSQPIYEHTACLGSFCKMGWRWEKGDADFLEVDEKPRGYCGAFGRPGAATL